MSQPSPPSTPPKAPRARRGPSGAGKEDFLLAVLECMEGSPKIDFEKLARKMNYKSAAVANARFHQIKRAVIKASDTAPASPPPSPATKKVEKVEKAKKAVVEEGSGGVVKKRGRGRPRKAIVVAPLGGEGGRGERTFGEDFGGAATGEGGIDPRILEMGRGNNADEEEDTEIEEKGY